jgi:hypothetical protein
MKNDDRISRLRAGRKRLTESLEYRENLFSRTLDELRKNQKRALLNKQKPRTYQKHRRLDT